MAAVLTCYDWVRMRDYFTLFKELQDPEKMHGRRLPYVFSQSFRHRFYDISLCRHGNSDVKYYQDQYLCLSIP
jgi:hypothetical protein